MTTAYVEYFKILLLCGYGEELQRYIDDALLKQDMLSEVVSELSFAGTDVKKILSVLNEYLLKVDAYDKEHESAVFELIRAF